MKNINERQSDCSLCDNFFNFLCIYIYTVAKVLVGESSLFKRDGDKRYGRDKREIPTSHCGRLKKNYTICLPHVERVEIVHLPEYPKTRISNI